MAIETSIYTPRTMGKIVERMPPVHTFFRDTFFKNRQTFVTKSVDVDFRKGNRALAPFVHPKIGGRTVPNNGYQTKSYTPPMLAPNKVTTVDDLLERAAGENPYSGRTPAERAVEKLARDFRELDEMNVRREEWMAATALFTGQIPIIGEGLNEVIDFDFSNTETVVTDALKWSADTSDPLADIERWHETVQKNGFINCNVCIMASDVVKEFLMDEKIQKLLDVKNYALAVIKPTQKENNVTYIGTIHELGLDLYQYNEWYVDDWTDPENPVELPMVPAGTLMMASTHAKYSMYYGAISILNQRTEKWETVAGKYVPDTFIKKRPDRRFLSLQSAPVPVPHEVDSWITVKVM